MHLEGFLLHLLVSWWRIVKKGVLALITSKWNNWKDFDFHLLSTFIKKSRPIRLLERSTQCWGIMSMRMIMSPVVHRSRERWNKWKIKKRNFNDETLWNELPKIPSLISVFFNVFVITLSRRMKKRIFSFYFTTFRRIQTPENSFHPWTFWQKISIHQLSWKTIMIRRNYIMGFQN